MHDGFEIVSLAPCETSEREYELIPRACERRGALGNDGLENTSEREHLRICGPRRQGFGLGTPDRKDRRERGRNVSNFGGVSVWDVHSTI